MQKIAGKILVVDDDADVLTAARVVLRQRYEHVQTEDNPNRVVSLLKQSSFDVILLDMNFSAGRLTGNEGLYWLQQIIAAYPDQQVVMITAYGDIKLAVEAMKHGAADFIVKPWDNEKLEATVYAAYQHATSKKEVRSLKRRQSEFSRLVNDTTGQVIGSSRPFMNVLETVDKVAGTDASILLLGENGTGKELIAKMIHSKSMRSDQPFVKVDVGSLSQNLFESELFGHKKGAFTDAREDRTGRIELATGGTLFLDEIGNIPLSSQVKLLSVLQNREVIPLGSSTAVPINVRLITATNVDIQQAISEGRFREDVLYRINTVEIVLPPLRERKEDIPALARHFVQVYCAKYRKNEKPVSADAMNSLQNYSWPGNIRELQHAVERAVIMSDKNELTKADFHLSPKRIAPSKQESLNLDEMERNAIVNAIQKHQGNMSNVARELGVGRTTLYRKMTKYGLDNNA
ncbi:MAG TPA: sigma-54 dependent transcriptional regulator [Chryseosolibacter sp.]